MANKSAILVLTLASLAVSACQVITVERRAVIGGPRAAGIEGQWIGTDGVAYSNFRSGQFTSTSTATGEVLAQGTYNYADRNSIDIAFYSTSQQRNLRASCDVVSPSRMSCELANGTPFRLRRA